MKKRKIFDSVVKNEEKISFCIMVVINKEDLVSQKNGDICKKEAEIWS